MIKWRQASAVGLGAKVRRVPQSVVLGLLHLYKRAVSPMLLPACRYVPTCSEYAADAVERYGAVRGAMMGVWRLLRCHPFAKGGFDPVPNLRAPAAIDSSPTNFINFRGQECPRHTSQERAWRAAPTQAGPSH